MEQFQKNEPINEAGIELIQVLLADNIYKNFARRFFKKLTNRGDNAFDRLKDKYAPA